MSKLSSTNYPNASEQYDYYVLVDFYLDTLKHSFINIVNDIKSWAAKPEQASLKVTIAVGITSSHFEQSS